MTGAAAEAAGFAPRLLSDLLDRAVADHGDAAAIDFMGRTWRYAELGREVDRCARGLQDRGVGEGARVALCLPNMPAYVILYFALHRIGAVVVNVNPLYTAREIAHLVIDSGATMIATCDVAEYHAKVTSVAAETGVATVVVCPLADALPPVKALLYRLLKRRLIARPAPGQVPLRDLLASDRAPDPVTRDPHDLAVLQYTGGTTGVPKAAMLSHANLTANAAQMAAHCAGVGLARERIMGVLPLFHVFALTTVLNFGVDTGSCMLLLPRFEMTRFLATMRRARCTVLFAVPTMLVALNALPEAAMAALRDVRFAVSGGAPLPREVREAFEARTGFRVVEGYGLSEAAPIIACNPVDGAARADSCGPAFPGTTIEIRDLDDPGRLVPLGTRGEVCARGPQVMAGYWNRPDETAHAFVDGALRTGDVGYLDMDGYLYLVDRIKDVILCGGFNVYPRVIEDALYEHPAVAEAVVIGVDDPRRGQSPKAFVTLRPGAEETPESLLAFLDGRLNRIEIPRALEIRETLPKTLIGKLSKKELVAEEKARGHG